MTTRNAPKAPRVPPACGGRVADGRVAPTAQRKIGSARGAPAVPAPCGGHGAPTVQPKMASSPGAPRVPAPRGSHVAPTAQPKMAGAPTRAAGQSVVQAMFWEFTPQGKYVWHYGPVTSWWWRESVSLDTGKQSMKDGYGVWERKSAWGGSVTKSSRRVTSEGVVRNVPLKVGRRTAFFDYSPATHAVFQLNGKVYGLAGDFNAVGLAEDHSKESAFTWVARTVYISKAEAALFHETAELTANHLTYTLFTQNCYTPVTAALVKVRDFTDDDGLHDELTALLDGLGGDNFGRGVVTSSSDSVYIIVKKNE